MISISLRPRFDIEINVISHLAPLPLVFERGSAKMSLLIFDQHSVLTFIENHFRVRYSGRVRMLAQAGSGVDFPPPIPVPRSDSAVCKVLHGRDPGPGARPGFVPPGGVSLQPLGLCLMSVTAR